MESLLDRPGNSEIQSPMFCDYRTNVELYLRGLQYTGDSQSPTLIVWGKSEPSCPAEGGPNYIGSVQNADQGEMGTLSLVM